MENNTKKCVHEGHRERLTDLALSAGVENLSNIQAVEFFLTYIFPRGDVNPLAHRLLDKFGTFSNIVDAEIMELYTVPGINIRSAKKIKLFGEMIDLYSDSKLNKNISLKNMGEFLDILEALLKTKSTENLYLFAFDHSYNFIQKRKFELKRVKEVGINPLELYSFISSTKLSYLIIAHNHPGGSARPSLDDHEAVLFVEDLIKHLECELIDSLIVGNDGIYSEKQDSFVRPYRQNDKPFPISQ